MRNWFEVNVVHCFTQKRKFLCLFCYCPVPLQPFCRVDSAQTSFRRFCAGCQWLMWMHNSHTGYLLVDLPVCRHAAFSVTWENGGRAGSNGLESWNINLDPTLFILWRNSRQHIAHSVARFATRLSADTLLQNVLGCLPLGPERHLGNLVGQSGDRSLGVSRCETAVISLAIVRRPAVFGSYLRALCHHRVSACMQYILMFAKRCW